MSNDAAIARTSAPIVLVVDDVPAIRELLKDLLGTEGYDVLEASNGVQALDQVGRVRPSAILMDLMMPIMSGAEATSRLKADPTTAAIPVLAMSAGRNLTATALNIPADDFIPKPFDLTELIDTLAHHAMQAVPQP